MFAVEVLKRSDGGHSHAPNLEEVNALKVRGNLKRRAEAYPEAPLAQLLRTELQAVSSGVLRQLLELIKAIQRKNKLLQPNQPNLEDCLNKKYTSQATLDQLLLRFIVNGGLPFTIIENSILKDIIERGFPKKSIMSRPTLMQRITENCNLLKNQLKTQMSKLAYIATTADAWSIYKKSYIGITATWINEDNSRTNCLLALKRLEGSHTYDILAKCMDSIYTSYEISDKVHFCTTDNGSNFVKCFREFNHILDEKDSTSLIDSPSNLSEIDDDTTEIINVFDMENENNFELPYILPKHHRYSAHILNFIATADVKKALTNSDYKKQSRSTFAKCIALWNKQSRSSKSADIIKKHCGIYLKTPNDTRWKSLFDAVGCLLKLLKTMETKLRIIMDDLDIVR
ncbi:uncharacterized protein LOC126895259 [Daktulosphaira vitifoliae]|uniref:uncharacterized protein LOC126895259 n=1 Tax=Daktulosphaira vitifoliae TaxID=58002 RepID=UPI0021AA1D62|nr:uncharacterized protein LOC126895259 [Daktulosphaira vitifoliae]